MKGEKEIKVKLSTAIIGILTLIIIALVIAVALLYKQNMEKENSQDITASTSITVSKTTQPEVTTLNQEDVKIRKFLAYGNFISEYPGVGAGYPSTYYFTTDGKVAYSIQESIKTENGVTLSFVGTWKYKNNKLTINIEQEKKAVGGKKVNDEIEGEHIEGYKEELSKKNRVIEFNVKGFKKEKYEEGSYPYEYIETDKGNLYQLSSLPEKYVKELKDLAENGYKDTEKNETKSNKVSEGQYKRKKTPNTEGYLEINNSTDNSFEFSLDCYYGTQNIDYGPHIGTLEGIAKKVKDNQYVYTENDMGYKYKLYFEIYGSGNKTKIILNDECINSEKEEKDSYFGNGHNVDFDGEYTK